MDCVFDICVSACRFRCLCLILKNSSYSLLPGSRHNTALTKHCNIHWEAPEGSGTHYAVLLANVVLSAAIKLMGCCYTMLGIDMYTFPFV